MKKISGGFKLVPSPDETHHRKVIQTQSFNLNKDPQHPSVRRCECEIQFTRLNLAEALRALGCRRCRISFTEDVWKKQR